VSRQRCDLIRSDRSALGSWLATALWALKFEYARCAWRRASRLFELTSFKMAVSSTCWPAASSAARSLLAIVGGLRAPLSHLRQAARWKAVGNVVSYGCIAQRLGAELSKICPEPVNVR